MPSISKRLAIAVFGIYFCYLVVAAAPASLVSWSVMKALPQLKLGGISGTVWTGRAAGAFLTVNGAPLSLGSVSWHLSPAKLLLLRACVTVKSEKLSGELCQGVTGSSMRGVQVEIPANLANSLVADMGTSVEGSLSLQVTQAVWNKALAVNELNSTLNWRAAKISVNGNSYALGDYAAALTADGKGGLAAKVSDTSGPIKVNLDVTLKAGQPPRLVGDINPGEQAPAAIRDALSLVAVPGENGVLHVSYPLGG